MTKTVNQLENNEMKVMYLKGFGYLGTKDEVQEGNVLYVKEERKDLKITNVDSDYSEKVEDVVNGEYLSKSLDGALSGNLEKMYKAKELLNLDEQQLYEEQIEKVAVTEIDESEKSNYDYEVDGIVIKYKGKLSAGQKLIVNGKVQEVVKVHKAEQYVSEADKLAYEAKLASVDEDKKKRVKAPKGKKLAKVVELKDLDAIEVEQLHAVKVRLDGGTADKLVGVYTLGDAFKKVTELREQGLKGHM